ncbi:type II secretion system F family protein [Sulfoacidibacillus thermotolerans]|uniref:Type II secretion system protein GspF domain-containing protein n=1 Tax=Sulfoacidibacillus thermotolerans TaxID=1765684 RepID=A0A2U3DC18_SULT2|nr:type II secretion system F family protein [Sulfoacidibacillus thermotolerans]PWI58812.1 hypothetical protein BM613_01595 [Sulfoacidibacillus thermotolerans]
MQKSVRTSLEIENLLVDLSDLLRSGVDLEFALFVISEQKLSYATDAHLLRQSVRIGETLSQALTAIHYPMRIISFVRIAELSGELDRALLRLCEHLLQQRTRRERTIKMLMYPIVLIILSILVVYGLAAIVMPNFEQMYGSMHLKLTYSTSLTFYLAHLMVLSLPPFILLVILFAGTAFFFPRLMKRIFFPLLLSFPLLRSFIQILKGREVMEVIALLLSSGIDLLSVIHVLVELDLAHLRTDWLELIAGLESGKTFAQGLSEISLLPSFLSEMIALAENTGELDRTAQRAFLHLERMIDRSFERFIRVAEPSLTIFVGLLVGGATLFLTLPMFSLIRQLS